MGTAATASGSVSLTSMDAGSSQLPLPGSAPGNASTAPRAASSPPPPPSPSPPHAYLPLPEAFVAGRADAQAMGLDREEHLDPGEGVITAAGDGTLDVRPLATRHAQRLHLPGQLAAALCRHAHRAARAAAPWPAWPAGPLPWCCLHNLLWSLSLNPHAPPPDPPPPHTHPTLTHPRPTCMARTWPPRPPPTAESASASPPGKQAGRRPGSHAAASTPVASEPPLPASVTLLRWLALPHLLFSRA